MPAPAAGFAAATGGMLRRRMVDPGQPAWFVDLPWLAELGVPPGRPAPAGASEVAVAARSLGARQELARQLGHGETLGVDMVQAAVDELLAAGALPARGALHLVARAESGFAADVVAGVARACRAHGALLVVAAATLGEVERIDVQLSGALVAPASTAPPIPGEVVVALRARGPTDGDLPRLLRHATGLGLGLGDLLASGDTVGTALLAARGSHLAMLHDPLAQGWPGRRIAVGDQSLAAALTCGSMREVAVAWDFTTVRPPAPFAEWFPPPQLEAMAACTSCGCGFLVVAAESDAARWLQHCADWNEPAARIGRIVARDPPS